ncbi:MAG: hypothetical protein ABSB19_15670 [Methylomonas sp.]|jgi:hypothetical protein
MKAVLFLMLWIVSGLACAEEKTETKTDNEQWQNTTLSDAVIQKIQKAQYNYKKCAIDAMRKPNAANLESRHATDAVIKECEPVLGEIRTAYTEAGVPGAIADRQLKKMRIQVTRNVLQELMYAEAAKKSGQP